VTFANASIGRPIRAPWRLQRTMARKQVGAHGCSWSAMCGDISRLWGQLVWVLGTCTCQIPPQTCTEDSLRSTRRRIGKELNRVRVKHLTMINQIHVEVPQPGRPTQMHLVPRRPVAPPIYSSEVGISLPNI
jgi:hypothetical protein